MSLQCQPKQFKGRNAPAKKVVAMTQSSEQRMRLSPRPNSKIPFDKETYTKLPQHDQYCTSPRMQLPNTGCVECSKRGLDCISDINNPRCRNCIKHQWQCSYEAPPQDEYNPGGTNTKRADSLGAAMCCQCNSMFTTDSDRASQGSQLYRKAAQVFALELVLDIGEACLKGGLPFPLMQARLRLATPDGGSDDVDGHIVAEGEPVVSSFGAVESLLNVLKAVPEVFCYANDAEALMGMFTLRWDSPQMQGRFLQMCSACCQFKDRT